MAKKQRDAYIIYTQILKEHLIIQYKFAPFLLLVSGIYNTYMYRGVLGLLALKWTECNKGKKYIMLY